jgi:hypothetical protein
MAHLSIGLKQIFLAALLLRTEAFPFLKKKLLWKQFPLFFSRGFLMIYVYLGLKRKRLRVSSQNQ